MVKQKKKRTKKYTGDQAAKSRPTITKVQAVNRSKVGQWWFERKRILKPVAIAGGVITGVIALVVGFLTSIN